MKFDASLLCLLGQFKRVHVIAKDIPGCGGTEDDRLYESFSESAFRNGSPLKVFPFILFR